MTTGERIKKRRQEIDMSADTLAMKADVARSTIFRYERGDIENIPSSKLEPIAKALNTTVAYLMGWTDSTGTQSNGVEILGIRKAEKRKIPMLGKIACGQPITANEEHDVFVEADTSVSADYCLTARGDSMVNIGIYDGTVVFIKEQSIVDNGDVAVVLINEDVTLKRVYVYDNVLVLRAENPRYKEMTVLLDGKTDVRILGKAVAYQNYIV